MAVDTVQTVVKQLCHRSQQDHLNQRNDDEPIGNFSNDQKTVTFNKHDLNIDAFVNMNTNPYSWAE